MKFFIKIFRYLLFLKKTFFFSKIEKKFILYNKKKLKLINLRNHSKNIILVDLFDWRPWIVIWSYLIPFLCKKLDCSAKFFYISLEQDYLSKKEIYIRKLKKIFLSFNVSEGINEYKFKYTKQEINHYEKLFHSCNKSKQKLLNFNYKSYNIGLLIYDTYVRINDFPTVNFEDQKLKDIFVKALKTLDEGIKFFDNYNVKCLVPSHLCYISYGIFALIAHRKKIPIVKIYSKYRGNNSFRIHRIQDLLVDEAPYNKFQIEFNNFSETDKDKFRNIGKEIIKKRFSGDYDDNIPYIKQSQYNDKLKSTIRFDPNKEKVFLLTHCYFDNPHKYIWMLFPDFYEQINYLLELSNKKNNQQWFYKPHPEELEKGINIHKQILKKFPNVTLLDKNFGNKNILNSNPDLIITNHGKACHEFAYHKIPVINTGENPHSQYNFSLNPKNLDELKDMVLNLDSHKSKLNFDKTKIYEYLYMDFYHYNKMYNRDKNFKEDFFASNNIKINNSINLFNYFLENIDQEKEKKINTYLDKFYRDNFH